QHGADDHPAIEAAALANRIVELMAEPVELEGRPVVVGTSVGIAIAPEDGESTSLLLRRADHALYVAKREGRCGYRLYIADPGPSIAPPAHGSVTARFDARSVAA